MAPRCSSDETRLAKPAPWTGPAADAANRAKWMPATPALRVLRGRMPLAYLSRHAWDGERALDPSYELALFDDGTVVYEGHRCVRLGGLVLARLGPDDLAKARETIERHCVALNRVNDGEVCADPGSLRLTCSNGHDFQAGSDHCRRDEEIGVEVNLLTSALLTLTGAGAWLGAPTERQGCEAGARDLSPRELAGTLSPG